MTICQKKKCLPAARICRFVKYAEQWQFPKRFFKKINVEIALFTCPSFLTSSRIPIGVVCSSCHSSAPDIFSDFSLDLILIFKSETIHLYTTTSESKQEGLEGKANITRFWVPSELSCVQSKETEVVLPAPSTPWLVMNRKGTLPPITSSPHPRKGKILKQLQVVAAMKYCNCNSAPHYDGILLWHYILSLLLNLL